MNKEKFISDFLSDLANLLEAGLPLDRALEILEKEARQPAGQIIKKIRRQILGGALFSEALEKQSRIFPNFLIGLLRSAEQSGHLVVILKKSAEHIENSRQFKNKLLAQMIYPAILLTGAIFVFIFIGFFVLPNFEQIFSQNQMALPLLTRLVFLFFKFLKKAFFLNLAIFAGLGIFLKFGLAINWDVFLLKLPVIADLIKKNATARFCQTAGILLESGVQLVEAISLSAQTIENSFVRARFAALAYNLSQGQSLKNALQKSRFFPERLKQMIAVAEESGALARTFELSGSHYQKEVEKNISILTALAEPAAVILMGGLVALIVAAVFLPLINLTKNFL